IHLWDTREGKHLRMWPAHTAAVLRLAYARDGRLASAGADGLVHVWGAAGSPLLVPAGPGKPVHGLAFGSAGPPLPPTGDDLTIRVWDAATGDLRLEMRGLSTPAHSLAYSPDGLRIVTPGDNNTLRFWDARGGDLLFTLSPLRGSGYSSS